MADERIPLLLETPAAVRFISAEPLLGPVDLCDISAPTGEQWDALDRQEAADAALEGAVSTTLDWVILGGESGPGARPCDIAWIRGIVGQCQAASVPVFVKQLGARPYDGVDIESGPDDEPRWRRLRDRKGGAMDEWPADLRVREWPR